MDSKQSGDFGGGVYLIVIAMGLVSAEVVSYLWRGVPWFKGQSGVVVLLLITLALSVTAWYGTRYRANRTGFLTLFLGANFFVWIYVFIRFQLEGIASNYSTFLLPMFLILVFIKPPMLRSIVRTGLVLALAIALFALGIEIFDRTQGPTPDARWAMWFGPLRDFGLEYRWSGYFGHPNIAGPVVALSLVFAFSLRGWMRAFLVIVLSVFLIASFSRTSMLAVVIGLFVLFVFSKSSQLNRLSTGTRILGAAIASLLISTLAVFYDPTLDGRTDAYRDYFTLWTESPWFGVGQNGVEVALAEGKIMDLHAHAHNIFLDVMTRYGLVGATLLIVSIAAALTLTSVVARQRSWPLAIVITYIVLGLAETPLSPLYLTLPVFWLILAVLAANAIRLQSSKGIQRMSPTDNAIQVFDDEEKSASR